MKRPSKPRRKTGKIVFAPYVVRNGKIIRPKKRKVLKFRVRK